MNGDGDQRLVFVAVRVCAVACGGDGLAGSGWDAPAPFDQLPDAFTP